MSPSNDIPPGYVEDPQHQTAGELGNRSGIIQRPGQAEPQATLPDPNAIPTGYVEDKAPHYQSPDEAAAAFDYKDSPFNKVMPERVARTLVKAAATAHDMYNSFSTEAVDKSLFFLSQHMRNKFATWQPGIKDADWENAAAQYEADRRGTQAAHPNFAMGGTVLADAAAMSAAGKAVETGVTLPAIWGVAQTAGRMAMPFIKKTAIQVAKSAISGAGFGLGAGLAYHYRKAIEDMFGGD